MQFVETKTYYPFSLIIRDYYKATGLLSDHLRKMLQLQMIQNIETRGETIINSENIRN